MRLETTELPSAEAPPSSTSEAFAMEVYNFPTGASPAIAMCSADAGQNNTPTSTDNVGSKPDSYKRCPWIPDRHIEEFLNGSGQPGG